MNKDLKPDLPHQPWALSADDVIQSLRADPESGLSGKDAHTRIKKYGSNSIIKKEHNHILECLVNQFKSVIIILLLSAASVSFVFGKALEGYAILIALSINTIIGFFTELKAVKSMEALAELSKVSTRVMRDGKVQTIAAEKIVPGDVVVFEGGDVVTADIRIIECSKLQADESVLTGESMPVSKQTEPVPQDAQPAERSNMLFKGTAINRGSGKGIVTATGMDTALGEISEMVEESQEEVTPLEKRLNSLGNKLIWITIGIAAALAVSGILAGKPVVLMIETSVALAIAAVPESMPIVATVALARGMRRMAKRNAIVRRLSSVETLGSTSVICTDKTGTLTENKMTANTFCIDAGTITLSGKGVFRLNDEPIEAGDIAALQSILEIGVLCNNATVSGEDADDDHQTAGEPLEVALLEAGQSAGITRDKLLESQPEQKEVAFDSDVKMMATYHKQTEKFRVAVKGAPEAVFEACSSAYTNDDQVAGFDETQKQQWSDRSEQLASQGLRVIALAEKDTGSTEDDPYSGLVLIGLCGFLDPPREEIKPALQTCRTAGVRTVMVTGDQALTASSIARALDFVDDTEPTVISGKDIDRMNNMDDGERNRLLSADILARVSPAHKLGIISLHQNDGSVVAMTGDGVNDAPALKKADIGIAMGKRGTQVAQEASDMVLQDDSFPTIVAAIEEGRIIFANIRKFVRYLIPCHISEVTAVVITSVLHLPLSVLPLQILFLNIITDVFPALALGVSEGSPDVMHRPPRDPQEPIITRAHWLWITAHGILMGVVVVVALYGALKWLDYDTHRAVTVSFLTLGLTSLWHVFNVREKGSGLFANDIVRNPFVWLSLAIGVMLLVTAIMIPKLHTIMELYAPDYKGWLFAIAVSFIPVVISQLIKSIPYNKERQ